MSTFEYRVYHDPSNRVFQWSWEVLKDGELYTYLSVVPETGLMRLACRGSCLTERAARRRGRHHARKQQRKADAARVKGNAAKYNRANAPLER